MISVAINGFGRIGRMVLRALFESVHSDIDIVAINDLSTPEVNAHLFAYDSIHGRFNGNVEAKEKQIFVNGKGIQVFSEPSPEKLPWKELGVQWVLECSGHFTKREGAEKHLQAGVKRVLISAPSEGADRTVVYGVNHKTLQPHDLIISNASCTTNCLAPVALSLHETVGIERGYMTTVHAYTGDQRLVDTAHKDLHRARAAALSMIPSSTGAARAIGLVLPDLKGKLEGTAIRVPTSNVSLIDFKFIPQQSTTVEEVNEILTRYASGPLKGVMSLNQLPLVSTDFNHNSHSAIVDLSQTQVVEGKLVRILAWYDNEWGFSNRMLDVIASTC